MFEKLTELKDKGVAYQLTKVDMPDPVGGKNAVFAKAAWTEYDRFTGKPVARDEIAQLEDLKAEKAWLEPHLAAINEAIGVAEAGTG